ncbi:MAG: PKD domain-containing protein [Desulfobacteraceae bacterium]|jgi:hypothetical protein
MNKDGHNKNCRRWLGMFLKVAFLCSFLLFFAGYSFAVAPDAPTINSPANSSTHVGGEFVTFSGSCTDTEDGVLSGNALTWVSSKNGNLGSGQNLIVNNLKSGIHTITLTATDSESLSRQTSISITVTNNAPTSTISLPINSSTYSAGTAVTFSGTGTDIDTGDTLTYTWTATLGSTTTVIGNQSVISVSNLAVGTHVIILTVSDGAGGVTASTPRTITITNNAPTATILYPPNNASFYPGATVQFNGSGSDAEDDTADLTYRWSCNQHGLLSTSASFTTSTLETGFHTITFRVTDTNGTSNTTAQSITIYVGNRNPTATITSPSSGTSYNSSQTIVFQGSGTDTEDGTLSGGSLVWRSSLEGATPIGTGNTFATASLQSGTHVITLTVSDNFTTPGTGTATSIITINNTFPTVSITSPASNSSFYENADVSLSGVANDPEDGSLTGTSLVWRSSLSGVIGTGTPLVIDTLVEGTHSITLTATDSNDAPTTSSPITITIGNEAPDVAIASPANGNSYNQGQSIVFTGLATDNEDGTLTGASITWTSNIDGLIGTGTVATVFNLSPGTHTITIRATDSQGISSTAVIVITVVNTAPVVTITTPPNGGTYDSGIAVTFTGSATDAEDGALTGTSLEWSSNLSGTLGPGSSLPSVGLADGSHMITLTATDSEGVTGYATITVHIGNTPPTVTILSPQTGTNVDVGEYITFQGTATDDDDGTLSGSSLVWTSSISGAFATGTNPAPINTLPVGRHSIILSATDSSGAVTYSTPINIRVGNTDPVATIIAPTTNSTFDTGEDIIFQGTGVDAEDGVLLTTSLVWTSSRQGQIGTGNSLTLSDLDSGIHIITLTVTDQDGATGTATITIKAQNAAPVPVVIAPASGGTYDEGHTITLQGTANDAEDGALTGTYLAWSSNLDGVLGTGTTLSIDTLSSGTHTITLTATDHDGSSATTSITLTITPMTLSANTLTIGVGQTGTVTILGGKSPYRVATRRSQTAMPSENNGTVSVLGVSTGSTVITVTDNTKNAQTVAVTVTAGTPPDDEDLPEADAGTDQVGIRENSTVTLHGRNVNDTDGSHTSFLWTQTDPENPTVAVAEPTVIISDPTDPSPTFIAPLRDINGPVVTFQLTVTTAGGTDTDQVDIHIADNGVTGYPEDVITFRSSMNKGLGVELLEGGDFSMFTAVSPDDFTSGTLPQKMIYGLFTFKIFHLSAGETAVISIYLTQPAPAGYLWMKYIEDEDTWIDFDREKISNGHGDGAVFSNNRQTVTLYITDDGPYDDNKTDTIIEDPSGLGVLPLVPEEGGSDGGCFIDSVF